MRILITGGNGYVGRTLCRHLLEAHDVCVVDNLRYGENRFRESEQANIRWESVDIRDHAALSDIIRQFQPQAIVHLAALHFIPECEAKPDLAVSTNVLGTCNVASLCPADCRLVFASTAAVYRPDERAHDEQASIIEPVDLYGWTKLHGEHYIRHYAKMRGYSACIIRLFNVAGPGETNPHVLPEIIAQLKSQGTTLKLGNIEPKRDYIHVDDVARGFAAAAFNSTWPAGHVETLNLGTQHAVSVRELLERLQVIIGEAIHVEVDANRMRPSDRPHLEANIARASQVLAWKPLRSIDETLRDLWREPDLPRSLVEKYR